MTGGFVGAHWIRAALQINPFAYEGKSKPSISFDSERAYNTALLDECERLGISLIAITDHWCVDTASGLIGAAKARGITPLPGFEANSSEGIHLLVIFEAGTKLSTVNAAIGACGVEPGCVNGTTGDPFKLILEKMSDKGALAIPAHVNVANSGMLTGRTGQPLVEMVKDPSLHAIAICPGQPAGTDQDKVVKGKKPYDRKHPLAVVSADDVSHPDQLKEPGSTTWFKVSAPRLESLKLAVRTPETRVSLRDPTGQPRAALRQISWTGGFLDGVTIPISSDLTALIGGRGTGKSTVIESLRYALGLDPIADNAKQEHKSIVDNVLRSGSIVAVEVEVVSPAANHYTIERVVPHPPVVRDETGATTNLLPEDVAGSVEIFGQHELAELASSPESVADMLRRFSGSTGLDPAHEDVLEKLAENRKQLERAERSRSKLQSELADIPRLEEQVEQFKKTEVAKRLKDLQRLDRDDSVFTEGQQRVGVAKEALKELSDPQLEAALTAEYEGIEESPSKSTLERVAASTAALAEKLKALAEQASIAIVETEAEIAAARADWEAAVKDQREGHSEVLRKLHEEGLEPDKYLETSKALDELKAKQPRLASHDQTLKTLQTNRNTLLGQLAKHERSQVEALHEAIRAANAATGGTVVVQPIAAPDRSDIMKVIARHTTGQRGQVSAVVGADGFSPRSFAKAIRAGLEEVEKLGIKGAQAASLINAGEVLCRELEELSVGHAVEVQLDISLVKGTRELRKMDQLSKGQRATALLLLLLGASTAPLVIDQPEDDLDNRFVYEGVVAHLRKLKGVRQIIASTHNANVPVLGDAELIVALEGDGQHGRPVTDGVGSLDDAPIRSLAENLLEGGPAAFNARQHLYGF